MYSGTPLIRTPRGQAKLSVINGVSVLSGVSEKKSWILGIFSTKIFDLRKTCFTAWPKRCLRLVVYTVTVNKWKL